jgi:hypothetical protein
MMAERAVKRRAEVFEKAAGEPAIFGSAFHTIGCV